MAEPSLIQDYLTVLARQLPEPVVEELAGGLDQAYCRHLAGGLSPDSAAQAAVTEFGEHRVIVAAFADASPARRAARRLLIAGPAVAACWAMALITARAWTWPVPAGGRAASGVLLLTVIVLLVIASLSRRYRSARSAATAGMAGISVLDALLLAVVVSMPGAVRLPMMIAAAASVLRIAYATRSILLAHGRGGQS